MRLNCPQIYSRSRSGCITCNWSRYKNANTQDGALLLCSVKYGRLLYHSFWNINYKYHLDRPTLPVNLHCKMVHWGNCFVPLLLAGQPSGQLLTNYCALPCSWQGRCTFAMSLVLHNNDDNRLEWYSCTIIKALYEQYIISKKAPSGSLLARKKSIHLSNKRSVSSPYWRQKGCACVWERVLPNAI